MNKNQYLLELENLLKGLAQEDRNELLYDYKEYFEDAKIEGKTDAEVLVELGSPRVVARELLAAFKISKVENQRSLGNMVNAVLASLGLGFFNSIFIIGPVVGIIGLFIGCCIMAIAFSLSPLVLFSGFFIDAYMNIWLTLFSSLVLCSLGVMLCLGLKKIGKLLYNVLIRYIKINVIIVKGVSHS